MKNWSELMASVEVLQTKQLILKDFNGNKPGTIVFTLRGTETYVDFYPDKGKGRELCRINYNTLQSSTAQAVKNIFQYIKHGILKISNED